MSQAVHLVSKSVPGYGLSEGEGLLSPGVSQKTITLNPCSSRFCYSFHSQVNVGPLRCASVGASHVCKASSGSYKRNPDFSRQNRQGFSRGRNRQNEDRDSFENLDDSDIVASKNGPYFSLSNSSKFQATAAPGPREKEIVELFRKVQAQLRERAAAKEEKKTEAVQGQGKENETVDSLLKLLRKHSTEQSKRGSNSGTSKEFMFDQQVQNGQYNRGKSIGSFDSIISLKDDVQEPNASFTREPNASYTRPVSNFQRRSPVPRMKFKPTYSDDKPVNSVPHVNSSGRGKKNQVEAVPKSELELELETEYEPVTADHDDESDSDLEPDEPEIIQLLEGEEAHIDEPEIVQLLEDEEAHIIEEEDEDEQVQSEQEDLSGWKLPELRALAKSRGLKGYSKMKKAELIDLLSG
ncbi:rho-N domain-containing protein 1, chloroplastic [Humulus lupulus]|uniref:rho-N domain-containing protein 1, chloroplastic n=1 Tax=Humulus lupulus TaxID=3486 RepID=UPI002B40BDAB|nr:rho-N domain-containing protein 1, chloroplastic [Humulus lupulus]